MENDALQPVLEPRKPQPDHSSSGTSIGGIFISGDVGEVHSPVTVTGGTIYGNVIGAQRAAAAPAPPLGPAPAPTPASDDLRAQCELLGAHRRTLWVLLTQQALHGSAHVPPAVATGIAEARSSIGTIKASIRAAGYRVSDHPFDQDAP